MGGEARELLAGEQAEAVGLFDESWRPAMVEAVASAMRVRSAAPVVAAAANCAECAAAATCLDPTLAGQLALIARDRYPETVRAERAGAVLRAA